MDANTLGSRQLRRYFCPSGERLTWKLFESVVVYDSIDCWDLDVSVKLIYERNKLSYCE